MARNNTKIEEEKGSSGFSQIKEVLFSERTTFILGLILTFIVIYCGISMVSFFFTGAADQSKVTNLTWWEIMKRPDSVENWNGVRGAFLSELLMNRLFGISSFMILVFFGSIGLKMMKLIRVSIIKRFLFCSSTLVWGSLFFGFVFVKGYEDTFLYLGGRHGYKASEFLMKNIGIPGMLLFLVAFFLIIALFTSKKTLPALMNFLKFNWIKKIKFKHKEIDVQEETEEKSDTENDLDDLMVSTEEEDLSEPINLDHIVTEEKNEDIPIVVTEEDEEKKDDSEKDFEQKTVEGDDEFIIKVPEDDVLEDNGALGVYNPRLDLSSYKFPTLDLLNAIETSKKQVDVEELNENKQRIKETLESFKISIASITATVGPTITLYEVVPDAGIRISKIKNLEDDIALSLSALGIRIIAPIPGKGTIGIEVPNKSPQVVSMRSVIGSHKFRECKYELPIVLGRTITNDVFMFDLCKTPHLLVAGATGQGKSVGLNAMITSLLYKKHPAELKFVLVDPKMVEFSIYSDIEKHYLAKIPDADRPIITDSSKVVATLNSLCQEMDDRYDLLMKAKTRDIKEYNEKFINRQLNPNKGHKYMPYIVVVIDEFGDLIMTAGKDIEMPIARIAQKARAVGIHMIIATQRPSTNIITGTIKANFPTRMAFRVSSMIDSRTILDSPGANQLIGRGDLLFWQGSELSRVQCAFVDTPEVVRISEYIGAQRGYSGAFELPEYVPETEESKIPGMVDLNDRDVLFEEAARLIVIQQQGSTSLLQRKFAVGYNRAGRLMDQLEMAGIVGPFEGSKARQVLVQDEYTLEKILNDLNNAN